MSSLRILEVDSPDPVRDADGALVLDWWCDLQCPDCRDGLEILDALQDRFGDRRFLHLGALPGIVGAATRSDGGLAPG